MKRFKRKVLGTFILISIIPLGIIITSNIYLIIRNRQDNIVEQQRLAIDNASGRISKYLQEQAMAMTLVVSAPIDSIWEIGFADLDFLLRNSFSSGNKLSLDFIDSNGSIAAKISARAGTSFHAGYLDGQASTSAASLPDQDRIGISEADVSESPDFRIAIKGSPYFGLLEFVDGAPAMRIASQIKNQDNEIIGVISAEISLREVTELIKEIPLGTSGFIYITDQEGVLIASGDKGIGQIGSKLIGHSIVRQTLARSQGPSGFETYLSPIGSTVVWNAGLLPGTGWAIMSEWPITDAFSVLRNLFAWSLIIALLILVLIIISAIIFAGTITRPIRELARGADEIKSGNLKYTLKLATGDEFELLGQQFNEMIKVLNENQRLRDEFVFIAAHELRTPVTAIRGYLEMILEGIFGEVSEPVKKNLKIIEGANNNLVELVQNLLEIARNEAGKMTIEMTDIDLNEKISAVNAQLASLAIEKGLTVSFKPLHEKAMIKADAGKLSEVLVNIIGNAIKYTTGNGAVEIYQEEDNEYFITHVRDHGIGMSPEELEKLFSKFYRVKNAETSKIQGTGLGLFITKEIVERMEGKIWVTSEKGQGSTFSFSLKKTVQT